MNPFYDPADRERAAELGDRVVAALTIYLLGAFSADILGWLQVTVCQP